jgi:hypothetical protein
MGIINLQEGAKSSPLCLALTIFLRKQETDYVQRIWSRTCIAFISLDTHTYIEAQTWLADKTRKRKVIF